MKYLLNFLEGIPDAPNLSDPEFQQLLVEVQAGKSTNKSSADAFFDSLEKIVNELKSSPESAAFQKPVSKRDAPDYYEVIKKPMDLTTVLRNVKSRKYKNKAEFATDIDLIWTNCFEYNSQEVHPLRAAARYMKQKADHHLEFLADKNEKPANPLQSLLSQGPFGSPFPGGPSLGGSQRSPSRLGESLNLAGADEDAAGESDDGQGEDGNGDAERSFRDGESGKDGGRTKEGETSRSKRGSSIASTSRMKSRSNGVSRKPSPPAFRPQLATTLDAAPALLRTPYTMTHYLPVSLTQAGPSFSDKGKAKEILYGNAPPPWYPLPAGIDDEDVKLEGYWWGAMTGDDAYVAGLPAVPKMVQPDPTRRRPVRARARRKSIQALPNGDGGSTLEAGARTVNGDLSSNKSKSKTRLTSSKSTKPVNLKKVVYRTVDRLHDARQLIHRIHEFQRVEMEGGLLPSRELETAKERLAKEEERADRKEFTTRESLGIKDRRKEGREVGEEEAALAMKKASAGLLAHAGFEGANETALDLFTRVTVDHFQNLGRTFRLLIDGFSQKMSSEEIILHALHENGQVATQDLEAHLKDEIEREGVKVTEMQRKIRQAFKEVTTAPVIEDDMMFNNNGEMLMDGNFADELGEDFLGLRDLGIDKEFGLSSLTVPSSLFYGRKKRSADSALEGSKEETLDYPPPPPFIPLNPTTIPLHLPGLLHAFYATRIEAGLSLEEDDAFDPSNAQIGTLGQIVVKNPPAVSAVTKKKRDREKEDGTVDGDEEEIKKKKAAKKTVQSGVGKGNWVRPSKEEKARRLAEKSGNFTDKENSSTPVPGGMNNQPNGNGSVNENTQVNGVDKPTRMKAEEDVPEREED